MLCDVISFWYITIDIRCKTIQYSTMQYSTIQYNTMQHNKSFLFFDNTQSKRNEMKVTRPGHHCLVFGRNLTHRCVVWCPSTWQDTIIDKNITDDYNNVELWLYSFNYEANYYLNFAHKMMQGWVYIRIRMALGHQDELQKADKCPIRWSL